MQAYLLLAAVAVLPVLVSIALYRLFRTEKMQGMSYRNKQILTGLVFGLVAISATEFGIPYYDTIVNARDAAPLCAGLIFGAPAGIIAGTIGAAERWFAVYWGVGQFTRAACTISTFLAGILSAVLRKYMFDDKLPAFGHAFIIGVTAEVIHMMIIFLFGMEYVKYTFSYIQVCSFPMITANALSVMIAVYAIRRMEDKETGTAGREKTPGISDVFQKRLVYIVLLALLATSGFTWGMQNQISKQDTNSLFEQNIEDVLNIGEKQGNEDLITAGREIIDKIDTDTDLAALARQYGVLEINVFNLDGTLAASSSEENIGKDAAELLSYYEFYLDRARSFDYYEDISDMFQVRDHPDEFYKFCLIVKNGQLYQTKVSKDQMNEWIAQNLMEQLGSHHIGEDGGLILMDSENQVITSTIGLLYDAEENTQLSVSIDLDENHQSALQKCLIGDMEFYCWYVKVGEYYLIGILPVSEANFSKSLAIYLNFYLLTITFATLFVVIYLSIKYLIVGNIHKVNESLSQITDGNLDTVVDVRSYKEFTELSDDINSTVDTLKQYIAEASARIDTELKYAREIQSSALPSVFPDRPEIDLYALMNPAREVGGDFYDFYFINGHDLVFLVADVSGKGIPASLFMMRAKTILKTYAENRIAIADIFTNVNYQLCEGNDTSMFVTAWMGILDMKTGILKYANAGHNRPLIRRKGGLFEYLEGPAGFVLAGMEGIKYREQTLTLEPGDEIFLYTDGVVEATDKEENLYGDGRLRNCLNEHADEDAKTLCESVRKDVDIFYDGAPLFDDITELSMKFRQYTPDKHGK